MAVTLKQSNGPAKARIWALVGLCLVAGLLWGANWYLVPRFYSDSKAEQGQFGDMFGAVNALFTALAFAGLIYTVLLQRDQLALQQKEIEESGETQRQLVEKQIAAQQGLFERQKAFQEEQRNRQVDHELKLEGLRQTFEQLVEDHRKAREQATREQFKNNLLRAIRCELEALFELYRRGMNGKLEQVKEGEFLGVRFALTEDWLTVYKANAVNLGTLEGSISRKIIIVYSLLKGLIEEYRINNGYLSQLEEFQSARVHAPTNNYLQTNYHHVLRQAQTQVRSIREAEAALKHAYYDLMATLDAQKIT